MFRRVNCFVVTCEHCQNSTLIKKSFFGDKKYICFQIPQKHKAIRGIDCGAFICNDFHNSLVCDSCKQKKYAKTLKR